MLKPPTFPIAVCRWHGINLHCLATEHKAIHPGPYIGEQPYPTTISQLKKSLHLAEGHPVLSV